MITYTVDETIRGLRVIGTVTIVDDPEAVAKAEEFIANCLLSRWPEIVTKIQPILDRQDRELQAAAAAQSR